MTAEPNRLHWRAPLTVWALMCALIAAVIAAGLEPNVFARFPLTLAGSACLLALLAGGLVSVARLDPLQRLVASAGWSFLALLMMLSWVDILTRRS